MSLANDVEQYRGAMKRLVEFLRENDEAIWSTRLDGWLSELTGATSSVAEAHAARTRHSLVGMGSVADTVLRGREAVSTAAVNAQLLKLVDELFASCSRVMAGAKQPG